MKNRYIILISLIFGLLTVYLLYSYLVKVESSVNTIQYGEVVVAAADVAPKTQVTNEMLKVNKVPVEYIHPLAVRKISEASGKITTSALTQGEQVLAKKLVAPEEVKYGLAYAVPVGRRALTVAVDEVSGVSGLIKPGDRVDVAAVVNVPKIEEQREVPVALVILQDIEVLAVGSILEEKSDGKSPLQYQTVTMAVTVEQSRPLLLASQKGNIRLMLRSPIDDGTVKTIPFWAENFLD